MERVNSTIEYDYLTIKITQSRISKGLLSIPTSLMDIFPDKKQKIKVYFDNNKNDTELNFTPYSSSSRECRIGGMRQWFELNQIQNNEELVIQVIDREAYVFRITTERQHLDNIKSLQEEFDVSRDDPSSVDTIDKLARLSNVSKNNVWESEFLRLVNQNKPERKRIESYKKDRKEHVPHSIRKLLEEVYKGKCQLTGFTFIQKNHKPYFEVHHIDENKGHYLKNLLVVSPNIHAKLTYSNKVECFDEDEWLRKVKFDEDRYNVFQFIDTIKRKRFTKEIHQ